MAITPADIRRIHRMKRKKRSYIEWYGMKRALLSYVGLPRFFPLRAHLQHGAGMIYRNDVPDPGVLKTMYQDVFLCNNYQKRICEKYLPEKNIYVTGSIFPLYRQQRGIVQDDQAEGTLFFTAHSSEKVEVHDDIEKTLAILDRLPDYLKPIKVSIYYADLLRGLHRVYEDRGYETFTNGHRNDKQFVDKFYQTLKSVKYTMGTTLGSQTYYAVEMGIPYFVMGEVPDMINKGNEYYPEGAIRAQQQAAYGYTKYLQARTLFVCESVPTSVAITPAQRTFVEKNIGYRDKISRRLLRNIMAKSAIPTQ